MVNREITNNNNYSLYSGDKGTCPTILIMIIILFRDKYFHVELRRKKKICKIKEISIQKTYDVSRRGQARARGVAGQEEHAGAGQVKLVAELTIYCLLYEGCT